MVLLELYSFAILGVLILVVAAIFVRTKTEAVICGLVGALLIAAQCLFIFALAGTGRAWSGDTGNGWLPFAWALGGVVAVIVYFVVTFARIEDD